MSAVGISRNQGNSTFSPSSGSCGPVDHVGAHVNERKRLPGAARRSLGRVAGMRTHDVTLRSAFETKELRDHAVDR
jgi:hypothetical protein